MVLSLYKIQDSPMKGLIKLYKKKVTSSGYSFLTKDRMLSVHSREKTAKVSRQSDNLLSFEACKNSKK